MVLKVYVKILLIVQFKTTEFLKSLCQLRNYFQKLYDFLKLVYQLITIYKENYFHVKSPTTFDERFKVTLVSFFFADFNFFSCELDNFTF